MLEQIDEQGRLNFTIADLLERIEARKYYDENLGVSASAPPAPGLWARIVKLLRILLSRGQNSVSLPDPLEEGASLVVLKAELERLRAQLEALHTTGDPVALTAEIATTVGQILPRVLASRVALSEADRSRLGEEHANLELTQATGLLPMALAVEVVTHRPLWLASVLGAPRRVPLAEGLFDLVIFDEASQCDIASALPLFARAKRAVVVGDEPRPRLAEGTFDSDWERRIYFELKDRGLDPIAQYEIAGRRLDFALFGSGDIKLDLEVDGRRWHADIDGKRKLSDLWRDHQLKGLGWRVRRFWVDELARDMEGCIELIRKDLS